MPTNVSFLTPGMVCLKIIENYKTLQPGLLEHTLELV